MSPLAPQPGLWLYLAVPIAAILLCGSKDPWALGILALLVGLTALCATPKNRLTAWLTIPVLSGLALCLVAFLPASWFPMPDWRVTLQRDFSIVMASTRSPQPGITLESWIALALGAAWLMCCIARGFTSSERRFVIRVLIAFTSLLACVSMVVRWKKIEIPFWQDPWDKFAAWDLPYFGPFANRNLFSEMMAVGAVLVFAATYDAFRRKERLWIPLAVAILPIFAAVLQNTSRTGVMMFFAGVGAWMFTATFQKRSVPRVAAAAAILLMLAAGFLLFGGHIRERASLENIASDSRLQTFSDAINVIRTAPGFGIGLGNFEPVFAITRSHGDIHTRAYHPENDWLWFAAEAGVACLLLGVVVLAVLVSRFGPWRKRDTIGRRDRRLRNAAGIGVLMLCGAGFVDPAMHAPGIFTFGCLLAGLALKSSPAGEATVGSARVLVRKAGGGLCILAGIAWLMMAAGVPVIRGNSIFHQLFAEAATLSAHGDAAGALEKWNAAIALKPLQYNLYFERARMKLRLGHSVREALDDFGRARHLEPRSIHLTREEFEVWLAHDPVSGIPALRETLKRDPAKAVEFFRSCVSKMTQHPELRPNLFAIAKTDPKLLLVYLAIADATEFVELLDGLLKEHPTLGIYTPEEKLRLFQIWYLKGDAGQLIGILEQTPEWRQVGWSVLATHKAKEGDFRAAYEVALANVVPPREPPSRPGSDMASLTRAFELNPADWMAGFNLAEAQRREDKFEDALATLDQIAKLPHAPAKVLYERGLTLAAKGDYAKAWEALRDYGQRVGREKPSS